MTTNAELELDGISKRFGAVTALAPLRLTVPGGSLIALLGPSGCGKTTTLRIVAGFERPDTGRVRVGGRDITELPPNRRGLGMVFQNYSLFPHMSVAENIGFGLKMGGRSRPEIDRLVIKLNPSVVGSGVPLFDGGFAPTLFEPVDVTSLPGGVQVITCERRG